MFFGAEPIEFVLFLKQVGLAVVGASALWGFVFLIVRERIDHEKRCLVLQWISERLLIPLLIGTALAALSSFAFSLMAPAYAHEGVALAPTLDAIYRAFDIFSPLSLVWVVVTIGGFILLKSKPLFFHRNLKIFYVTQFVLVSILISFPAWTGSFGKLQWFFIGHSFHSIFTLGTVLVLDFLFLISKSSPILKQHIYPLFPTMSKVIWVGLAIELAITFLIYPEAFSLTPKFFFMQTLIGIIIINGVLLSGVIMRKMLISIERGGRHMERRWMLIADFAGAVSITSWLTIAFVDSFEHLTLGYGSLMTFYIVVIAFLFIGHNIWEHVTREPILPSGL